MTIVKDNKQVRSEGDRPQRSQRIPFGVPRRKLEVPMEIPGYHLSIINDDGGRINQAQQGGYEFVSPNEVGVSSNDSQVKYIVGKKEDGSPMTAYLMKIKQEWRDEDLLEQSKVNRSFEEAIKKQKPQLDGVNLQHSYIPSAGMSISRS